MISSYSEQYRLSSNITYTLDNNQNRRALYQSERDSILWQLLSNIRILKLPNWYFRLPLGRFSWPAPPISTYGIQFVHTTLHLNIRMELVFHTTSRASRSRPPSTYFMSLPHSKL